MKYYYLGMDYDGWYYFEAETLQDIQFMDYPFVTTCKDNVIGMMKLFRKQNKDSEPVYDTF